MIVRLFRFFFRLKAFYYSKYILSTYFQGGGRAFVTHISAYGFSNAGDFLLSIVLRDLFSQQLGIKKWHHVYVRKLVGSKDVKRFNNDDAVVIGGGGLFLCDTAPNDNSGWQWNISIQNLNKIEKPIIAFAIGYNRFRGQDDFKPIFKDHINCFVKNAVFVGLRNHGSVEKIKGYLENEDLKQKLVFQPCMTTLISKIYPNLADYKKKQDYIVVNCAFDRFEMRGESDGFLRSIARVLKQLPSNLKIKYAIHVGSDIWALKYFDEVGVKYDVIEFYSKKQIVKLYAGARLVIGMRGHSQMIPFGCNTPILSIISHDKMKWFLDDIHHPEWGVDVLDPNFYDLLLNKSINMISNYEVLMNEEQIEQDYLWSITINNLSKIKKILTSNDSSKNYS